VALDAADAFTPAARLRIEQPAKVAGVGTYAPGAKFALERGAHAVSLSKQVTWVELRASR
jgi:hypothetical protein